MQGHLSQGRKPGGGSGCLLGIRAMSSGDAALSGSDVGGGLGAVALVGSSTLDVSEGALFEEVGAMGSFLTPPYLLLHVEQVAFLHYGDYAVM